MTTQENTPKQDRGGCMAIIPARGGSKGIPDKNIRPVAGAPLIAHVIRAAQKSAHITRIVVSTDSDAIAAAAKAEGAEVVQRPAEISGDTASSESALLHVLQQLDDTEHYRPALLVFLQCTSPLSLPEDIDAAIETLRREGADSALTATPFHGFIWRTGSDGGAVGVNHEKQVRPRRQDRAPEFLENGAIYVMNAAMFREKRHRFFGRTALSLMPAERSLDIDSLEDLAVAERVLTARNASARGEPS